MSKLRVGLVFGGRSGEHEVSLNSAKQILAALDADKYEVVPIGIAKDGTWLTGAEALALLEGRVLARQLAGVSDVGATHASPLPASPERSRGEAPGLIRAFARLLSTSAELDLDVVFPVLHGTYGEDGTVQGLLELADVPYVGAGVLGSAVGMDKVMMKAVFARHGLPQVDYDAFLRRDWEHDREGILDRLETRFRGVMFVKPANLGSSVGVSKVRSREELAAAIDLAAEYGRKIIVEQGIVAREIECGILGNDDPIASLPGEVRSARDFYDYFAKYADEATEIVIPSELPLATVREIQQLAISAFKALDGAGLARVDFFLETATGRVLVNEINTIPGFTRTSAYPQLWEASGLSRRELADRLIQLALDRHAEKQRNRTSYDSPTE